jgi:glycosyltransferase involved in cell wall biosynthesis
VADLISEMGAGIVVPPEDAQALALAIQELMRMDPSQREHYGENARIAYQKYFDRNELIRQYDQLIRA